MTIHLTVEVGADRELHLKLPLDTPTGEAEVSVTIPERKQPASTLGALLDSGSVGIWRDRDDLGDPVAFAEKLRHQAWQRSE